MNELHILSALIRNPGWHEGKTLAALSKVDALAMRGCLDRLLSEGLIEQRCETLGFGGPITEYRAKVMKRPE